jgi:hypothetical protein
MSRRLNSHIEVSKKRSERRGLGWDFLGRILRQVPCSKITDADLVGCSMEELDDIAELWEEELQNIRL